MVNNENFDVSGLGPEHYEEQLKYFESALEGLRVAYALMSDQHAYIDKLYKESLPTRKEVVES